MQTQLPSSKDLAPLAAATLAAPEPPAPEEEVGVDWRRHLQAIRRYKWWVAATTLLGLVAGVGVSRLFRPLYVAQGTVWIEVGTDRGGLMPGPIQTGQLLDAEAWLDLLKSYVVLDTVVREQHLYLRPSTPSDLPVFSSFGLAERFRPGHYTVTLDPDGRNVTLAIWPTAVQRLLMGSKARGGVPIGRSAVGDSIGPRLGFLWAPPAGVLKPGRVVSFAVTTPRDAARKLSDALQAGMDRNGNFMWLMLAGTDPDETAKTLNSLMKHYVRVAADLKRAKLVELTKILDAQLQSSAEKLRSAENALETYRVQTITLPTDRGTPVAAGLVETQNPVFSNYFSMKIELDQVRRDRDALERILAELPDSGLPVEALAVIGAVQSSSELSQALKELTSKQTDLRALRYRYTDATPAVQRLQAEIDTLERGTIPGLAEQVVAGLTEREQTLEGRVQAAGGELRDIPPRAIEEARLQREVAINENLYTTLQARYEEARLADASSIPDVRVLDAAIAPEDPVKDTAPRVILFGLLGGLGFALIGAVLLDRMDSRIRYTDEVTRRLGLSIVGALPHVKAVGKGSEGNAADTTHVLEALREIRLNLIHAGLGSPLMLTITSPGTGDGKSFLSSNLAISFGDAGYRTLLIDGDVRRGALHRLLKTARTPGLTDHLAGSASLEQVVQSTAYPAVSFIGSGTRQHASPELLGSTAMADLLAAMRRNFHVILVDSPPLGAGIDPYVLGAATGNLVLVVRTGTTDRGLARAKLEVLDRLPVRMLGAVLNDVPKNGDHYYYRYSYLSGYETQQEHEVSIRELPSTD